MVGEGHSACGMGAGCCTRAAQGMDATHNASKRCLHPVCALTGLCCPVRPPVCPAQNAYFPLFITEDVLMTEKEHVEGFAPEVGGPWLAGGRWRGEERAGRRWSG